jgi:membrane protein
MKLKAILGLCKEAFKSWKKDYAPSMGAALAYYTLFSIAPLLLIVISVAGFFFGAEAVRGQIFGELAGLMGAESAEAIESLMAQVSEPEEGLLGTLTGVVMLLIGATTVFAELQGALDRIWRAPARQQGSGLWGLVRSRLLSFGMILGFAFLLMVSLVVSALVAALGKWWGTLFQGWEVMMQALNMAFGFVLVTLIFAMIYKFMPRVHIQWRDVWVGAAVTAGLFTLGEFLIGLYLGKSEVASGFGAAGSLVLVMVWVYYSAQIFLLGAEFTWVYAHAYGSRRSEGRPQGVDSAVGERNAASVPRLPAAAPAQPASAGVAIAHGGDFSRAPALAAALRREARERRVQSAPEKAESAMRAQPMLAMGLAAAAGALMAAVLRLCALRWRRTH